MEVELSTEGVRATSQYWVMCRGRATVSLDVTWKPAQGTKGSDQPPACRLSYLTAPGLVPGALPGSISLRPVADESGEAHYHGSKALTAPFFHPLRVRIELQPQFGRPHAHVVYVIPSASVRVSMALVIATICTIALLATVTLSTLRVTPGQTAAAIGTVVLFSAALYVLRSALRTLRSDDLPFFGITHLVYRSAGACALVLALLVGLIQQCVVVIRNDTEDDVTLALPWRDQKDVVAAGSQISVVPPDVDQLAKGLLDALGEAERDRALCLYGVADPEHACRETSEELVEDWRLHPFTPKMLILGCGRRWGKGLRAASVLPDGHQGIFVDGDDVWLAPPSDSHCGRDERATLWYQDGDGAPAHYVRYPWGPNQLDELGTLWIAMVEDASSRTAKLALRSMADVPEGAPREFRPETRIFVSGLGRDRAWPLMSLATGDELRPVLELGEPLPKPTDPFSIAARLECERIQARSTGLRAVRLGYRGAVGWLAGLTMKVATGLSWSSKWTLLRSSSLNVAVPWVCEAFPGDDPRLTVREPFSSEAIELHLAGPSSDGVEDAPALVVPAHLMSRHIEIRRPRDGTTASEPHLVGTVECEVSAEADDEIVVGRLVLDDRRRHGQLQRFALRSGDARTLGRWIPAGDPAGSDGLAAWMCWRRDLEAEIDDITVIPLALDGTTGVPLAGHWNVKQGVLALDPTKPTICYRDQAGKIYRGHPPAGVDKREFAPLSAAELDQRRVHHPDMQGCDRVHEQRARQTK